MIEASRDLQVFAKPAGAACNLECRYCYYLPKQQLCPAGASSRMTDDLLERYIVQHIEAAPGRTVTFSWHGGEPTILGLDYFRTIEDAATLRPLLATLNRWVTVDEVLELPPVRLKTVQGFDTAVFSFTTDIPCLTQWGTPLLLGPGSIHVAHTDREHVAIGELLAAVPLYLRLVRQLLAE